MGDVNPEDRQIVERLAKLQQMYNQIGGLRTLLPEKLINPTRFALEDPSGFEPEKLASSLRTAAQTGSSDIQKFKKDWHSEDVRQLWSAVNGAEQFQGDDAWVVDYSTLLQDANVISGTIDLINGDSLPEPEPAQENILEIVSSFKTNNPDLKVDIVNEATGLPVNVSITHLAFQVAQLSDGSGYKVSGKPDTEAPALRSSILENLKPSTNLSELLDTLAAYKDITTKSCDICNKLMNQKRQLPLVRRATESQPDQPTKFQALHRDCL
ncbi:hypothetical protein B0A52_07587 [Exophiala mesophila]|uniref:Uncharacterized protein n=1 Tax=Exophiala mesophila TaxID=212818 RepID=A0A438MY84_EXOME|nr:hypothetical protein B0A52_07587 [Exophiala mesophila]